jgi:hypothetical protein
LVFAGTAGAFGVRALGRARRAGEHAWQTLIGLNILSGDKLFQTGADLAPTDMFSYDQATLKAIMDANPSLSSETAYLFADAVGPNRVQRPFLICNMAMFVTETETDFQLLAPVQVTPFMTGIVGAGRPGQ